MIGIIGNTQGVMIAASPRPKASSKKACESLVSDTPPAASSAVETVATDRCPVNSSYPAGINDGDGLRFRVDRQLRCQRRLSRQALFFRASLITRSDSDIDRPRAWRRARREFRKEATSFS